MFNLKNTSKMTTLVKSNGTSGNAFFPEFPALFDDLLTKDFFSAGLKNYGSTAGYLPAVNVKESDNSYQVEVAVPGMEKKDFKVEVKNNSLLISAQKENKQEEKDENGRYVRKEFGYQSFTRSFKLPEQTVDNENISASYKDGILSILVPKKSNPAREIQIG
jgi:HSP20 family protein